MSSAPMRIAFINSPVYDYLTAAIVEGLESLKESMKLVVHYRCRSNYAPHRSVRSRDLLLRDRSHYDWTILGSNVDTDEDLFHDLAKPFRSCFLDGSDSSAFERDPTDFDIYFKRELPIAAEAPANVLPCPFAVEQRWIASSDDQRPILLSALFGPRPGERADTLEVLATLDREGLVLGPIPPSRTVKIAGILRGQTDYHHFRQHPFGVGHNYPYYRALRRSLASVSVTGGGQDTARWWEILGSGALLIARTPDIQIPHSLQPDEHYLRYLDPSADLPDLVEKIRRRHPTIAAMRAAARRHILQFHTTRARARYLLTVLGGDGDAD